MVEGVETEQQWRAISRIHLDAVQGFLIQRPEPLQPGPEDHNISLTIS
jgi:EAL domain-containing protein (putative c-di-GMP-specific phosphodiesterase class I)